MRVRGISNAVGAILLIVVTVAVIAGIWYSLGGFTKGTDVVQVQAMKVQNKYVNAGSTTYQVAVVTLQITPKTDKYLVIDKIVISVTASNGATDTIEATYSNNAWSGAGTALSTLTVSGTGPNSVTGGQTVQITFTFKVDVGTDPQISSVVFQVVMVDPSGKQYTFTTNEVSLT